MTEPAPTSWSPRVAGALLAVALATAVPGLVPILDNLGQRDPQTRALFAELAMAMVMALFGARVARAAPNKLSKAPAVLLLVGYFVLVVFIGIVFTFASAQGTTEGGAVLFIGAFIALGAGVMHVVIAVLAWWAIGSSARLEGDAARQRFATWLLALGAAHLVLKGVSGGSLVFGAAAAGYAALLQKPKVAAGAIVAALCIAVQTVAFVNTTVQSAINDLPLCATMDVSVGREADALGKKARAVPGVGDAAADDATVFVVGPDAGVLLDATRAAVEKALVGTECAIYRTGGQDRVTKFKVEPVTYVDTDVVATFHPSPNSPADAEQQIDVGLRKWFDKAPIHVTERNSCDEPYTPTIFGWVDYRVGEKVLRDAWSSSKPGSVLVLRKLEIVKASQ